VRRALARTALALTVALGATACGDDDPAATPPTTDGSDGTTSDTEATSELPPQTPYDLEPFYAEALADIGMRLTNRGGLIDRSGGGYVSSPEGTHLALYVEPIADRTTEEFIDGIRDVAVIFSDVFERWPGLESYDVCQEPTDPDGTQEAEPLPVTQIELTRAESEAIDWETVTVVDLVRGSRAEPPTLALRVGTELANDAAFKALEAQL
jgi:hypothetical protein